MSVYGERGEKSRQPSLFFLTTFDEVAVMKTFLLGSYLWIHFSLIIFGNPKWYIHTSLCLGDLDPSTDILVAAETFAALNNGEGKGMGGCVEQSAF